MGPQTLGAVCLGPTGSQQGGHWFLSLTSGVEIIRHRWASLPAPREVIHRVNSMGRRQDMPSTLTFAKQAMQSVIYTTMCLMREVSLTAMTTHTVLYPKMTRAISPQIILMR